MHRANRTGITKIGRGHNLRLMREIEELLVGSIRGEHLGLVFKVYRESLAVLLATRVPSGFAAKRAGIPRATSHIKR